jgi:hypothetical protein
MATSDLEALVDAWEYWTQGDPLLRQAMQASSEDGPIYQEILDHARERLILLEDDKNGDDATRAAVNTGWAVLAALQNKSCAGSLLWKRTSSSVLQAHHAALKAAQHAK